MFRKQYYERFEFVTPYWAEANPTRPRKTRNRAFMFTIPTKSYRTHWKFVS